MASRALGRNVHIYRAGDTNTVLGGLMVTNGMTNANFYSIVEIVFIFDNEYTLSSESGVTVQRDNHPLQAGKYLINTAGSLTVNNEPWLVRTISVGPQAPPEEFIDAVRERDYRCVITGEPALNAEYGNWRGFKATPIFPLTYEQHWVTHGYGGWITLPRARGSISSVQNGMLLRTDIAIFFESYDLSINPDVSMTSIFLGAPTTNNPVRTVTRSSPSWAITMALLAPVSIRPSFRIPNDPLMRSCAGTSDRLCLRM